MSSMRINPQQPAENVEIVLIIEALHHGNGKKDATVEKIKRRMADVMPTDKKPGKKHILVHFPMDTAHGGDAMRGQVASFAHGQMQQHKPHRVVILSDYNEGNSGGACTLAHFTEVLTHPAPEFNLPPIFLNGWKGRFDRSKTIQVEDGVEISAEAAVQKGNKKKVNILLDYVLNGADLVACEQACKDYAQDKTHSSWIGWRGLMRKVISINQTIMERTISESGAKTIKEQETKEHFVEINQANMAASNASTSTTTQQMILNNNPPVETASAPAPSTLRRYSTETLSSATTVRLSPSSLESSRQDSMGTISSNPSVSPDGSPNPDQQEVKDEQFIISIDVVNKDINTVHEGVEPNSASSHKSVNSNKSNHSHKSSVELINSILDGSLELPPQAGFSRTENENARFNDMNMGNLHFGNQNGVVREGVLIVRPDILFQNKKAPVILRRHSLDPIANLTVQIPLKVTPDSGLMVVTQPASAQFAQTTHLGPASLFVRRRLMNGTATDQQQPSSAKVPGKN